MNQPDTRFDQAPGAAVPMATLSPDSESEANEAEFRRLLKFYHSVSLSGDRQYLTGENYSLKIIELFVLIAVIGVGLSLIRNFDLLGAFIIFLLASLFSIVASWLLTNANQIRFWNQLLWGILVPAACVMGDPFVFGTFKGGVPQSIQTYSIGPYFVLLLCMFWLMVSWFLGARSSSWLHALLAGQLMCGGLILFLIGILLLPLAMLGMLSLLGLICLVPFIAGAVYFRTSRMHHQWARLQGRRHRILFSLGFVFVLGLAGFLTFVGSEVLAETLFR